MSDCSRCKRSDEAWPDSADRHRQGRAPRTGPPIPGPKRTDGAYEYTTYLQAAGAGDELRENTEVIGRFFDARGATRPAELEKLRGDVAYLLLPSPERAVALDRGYRAIVEEQSFTKGRDAVLAPSKNVYDVVSVGSATGITKVLDHPRLARGPAVRP